VPRGGQPSLTIASRDFARGECQSSILQLAKPRVARGVSTWALADGYMQRALTRKGPDPYRHLGDREFRKGSRGSLTHELANRERKRTFNVGPTVSRGSLSRPFEADTWRAIRLPAFSPIAVSKRKKQLHHIPMREVARAFRTWGPQQRRVSLGPSDLKDAWRQLSHLGVSPIATMISKDQLLPIRERRKRLGNKHVVTARGHLGKERSCVKKAKGVEFSCRGDHRDLQVPSDPISILFLARSK
jgi:hypothetical protein